ncbi:MAG: CatB-related O-acetyltransferase [Methylovulum sp.]|uniref:CatB-related O-acetyltransferase n=1 Tax=Methylovulum sp. TaxID=1916980 RepID=UPI0026054776|nr:CatB-related O-acetyltransferase [Methylovulum sp.]MDD2722452.1 CatB-related O-acetyltransferase [Methylovulum sp.]MDD5124498.1 CatB-related O-acetyltransferase [Methylovulum sp.]
MILDEQDKFYTANILSKEIKDFGWSIGEYTYGKPIVVGKRQSKLNIGKYCSIATGATIFLGHEHRTDWVTTYPFSVLVKRGWANGRGIKGHPHTKGDVNIGHDVWLAQHCSILSGVTIGTGAVVATRALVVKDVPPYSIVAGVPARVTRYRFDADVIEKLLATKWWDRSAEEINEIIPLLLSPDPMAVVRWLESNPV